MNQAMRSIFVAAALIFAWPASATEGAFDSNGVRIRYIDEGQGVPVLLLHGQNSSIEGSWTSAGIVANLAQDYRVIAFDLRGHGKSDRPHEPSAYGEQIYLDAIRLLDHLGIRKAHFVGYSLGGILSAKLLTTNPDRFISATMLASGPRLAYSDKEAAADQVEADERARDCTSRSFYIKVSPPGTPEPTEQAFEKMKADCRANVSFDPLAIAAYLRTKSAQVVTEPQFAAVKVPMMSIGGDVDPIMQLARDGQRANPALKVTWIEGATHSGPKRAQDRPEFIANLREFLAARK